MAEIADALLLEVLKACAPSAPDPLYPATFAAHSGLDRNLLDEALDFLRLRGLVRFTDWVQGKGQGYALTPEGSKVLEHPGLLRRAQPIAPARLRPPEADLPDSPWARGENVRATLLHPTRPVATTLVLAANILMFLVGLFIAMRQGASVWDYTGSGTPVVNAVRDEMGALEPGKVLLKGEWWRLLAYAFIHGGILHIGMNMYVLFALGPLLETMWGSVRYAILYLVSALVGGCAVMLTANAAVGASGALCGLITSLGVWVYLNRGALPPHMVSSWMRNVFTNIILVAIMSTMPGISWEGHLGGALGGALISVPLNYQRFGTRRQKALGVLGIVAVPVLALGVVYFEYRDIIVARSFLGPRFRDAQSQAVTVFNEKAAPLLQAWKNDDIDKKDLPATREAFTQVERTLQETQQRFDKAGPFQDARVADCIGRARDYLEEWSKFYVLFAKAIEASPPWPVEQEQAIDNQEKNILLANGRLARAPQLTRSPLPLFPGVYRER